MLPQESCMANQVYPRPGPGPACPCIHKPLPCLVDGWVPPHNSVHYEQQLTIETSSEYSLDRRMFPGWDPESGEGQAEPALLIGAMPPKPPVHIPVHHAVSQLPAPCGPQLTVTPAAPGPRHGALPPPAAAWTPVTQDTPAPCACHPAFRPPTIPEYHMIAHRQYQQRLQQQLLATTTDTDFLALLDSLDAEPKGYALDVDWLIGKLSPPMYNPHMAGTDALGSRRECQQQQQRVSGKITRGWSTYSSPAAALQVPDLDYQSQFYPGAVRHPPHPHPHAAPRGARPVKRRLPTDTDNQTNIIPFTIMDVGPMAKRLRWGGMHDLGLNHIPSPLQNRAY